MSEASPVKHALTLIILLLLILYGAYHLKTRGVDTSKFINDHFGDNSKYVYKSNGYCSFVYNDSFVVHYMTMRISQVNNPSYLSSLRKSASEYMHITTIEPTWNRSYFWNVLEYMYSHYYYDWYRTPATDAECNVTNFPYYPHQLLTIRSGVCFDYAVLWAMVYAAYGYTGTIVYVEREPGDYHAFFVYKNFAADDNVIKTFNGPAIWYDGTYWKRKKDWKFAIVLVITPNGPISSTKISYDEFVKMYSPKK